MGGMSRIVIASDKFKGTLTAAEVAAHVTAGLSRAGVSGAEIARVPVADGGDGTAEAAVAAGYRRVEAKVRGPVGVPVTAAFGLLDGTAVIEAAQACGLSLLPAGCLAPLTATSYGVGELILTAVRMGATRVVLGLGGVATTDGGAGLVQALGARLADVSGAEVPPGGAALARLCTLDLSGMHDLAGVEFLVASDVDNPLLGPSGAAAVYGPQKGASASDVPVLGAGLARWADVAEEAAGMSPLPPGGALHPAGGALHPAGGALRPAVREAAGAGAAGGLGFAALLFLGARMRPGISLLLDMVSFSRYLDGARLVITGEGSLDTQSLHGKAPVGVARAAAAHHPAVPVVAVAGVCTLRPDQLREAGIAAAYALTDIEPDVARCRANAGPLLERLAARLSGDWLG
jgi:glycerate kinase